MHWLPQRAGLDSLDIQRFHEVSAPKPCARFVEANGIQPKGAEGLKGLAHGRHTRKISKGISIRCGNLALACNEPVQLLKLGAPYCLSLIHISEPTRRTPISYAVFCLKT